VPMEVVRIVSLVTLDSARILVHVYGVTVCRAAAACR
jgi:hypothetical protein